MSNAPQLRNAVRQGWKKTALGAVGTWKGGGTPRMSRPEFWDNGHIPWATSADVRVGPVLHTESQITKRALDETSTNLIGVDSLLFVMRSGILRRFLPIGRTVVPTAINQDLKALTISDGTYPAFLFHALVGASEKIIASCMKSGTTVESIELKWLKAFKVLIPDNPIEQQAIAKALGDVDGLIASLEALIAKKRDIKQGAMQELLSGPAACRGLKGEWVRKPIGTLFKPLRSVALSRAQTNSTGDIGYVHYGDIHTKFHGHLDLNNEALPCVDAHRTRNATHLQEGDWIFADASEDYDGVAKAVEIVGTPIKPSVAGLHTLALRDVDNSFAPMFKGYLAAAGHFRKQVLRAATGMKVFGVSKTKMLEIELHHPENKIEQAAIAETLHSMDAEITALQAKLTKTRDVKQGMMQVLLTGEVRLL